MQSTTKTKVPYAFSAHYSQCMQVPAFSVDPRHIYWIHEILLDGNFRRTLEIGVFHGASSTAFIEAINRDAAFESHFCDVVLRPSFMKVVNNCKKQNKVFCHKKKSVDFLSHDANFDLVLIDGDHRLPCVQRELELLLKQKPRCIIAHDTSAQSIGIQNCEGPAHLKRELQAHNDYYCLEDNASRLSERTARGMFLATSDLTLLGTAKRLFRKWCTDEIVSTDANTP